MLGLNNYGVRAVARTRDNRNLLNKTFSEIYVMQLSIAMIVLLIYVFYLFATPSVYRVYFSILSLQVVTTMFDVNWFFFGVENFKITVIRNTTIKLVSLVSIFVLIHKKEDLWIYMLIHVGSILASAIALWPYLVKTVKFKKVTLKGVCSHLKPNLILFIPVVAVSVYKYMDKIMLGNFSVTETGYYENVEKILSVALGIIVAFGTVMLPRMSNLVANEEVDKAKKYISTSMEFIMFLSLALACGLFAIAPEFVPVFFGEGFDRCINVMQALAVTVFISSWANVLRTQYLIPFQKDRVYVYSVIAGAVTNFVLNLIFIKTYGAMGAVLGTIAAESVVAIIQTYAVHGKLECRKMIFRSLPYFVFGLVMIAAVRGISVVNVNIFTKVLLEIFTGVCVYIGLSLIYKLKTNKDELTAFKIFR
jgi:O-antigen/teichoic acid export membrane protein